MTVAAELTALDTAFLRAERPDAPMHLGGLAFFEGAPLLDERERVRIADVRRRVACRLHLVPRFRQRVQEVPFGRPIWVDDAQFDVTKHVRRLRVRRPGDFDAVVATAEALNARLLDRGRPLWELWFLDGLADGRVALLEKAHHTLIDGVSGVDVAMVLLDLTPDAPDAPNGPDGAPVAWLPAPPPAPTAAALASLTRRAAQPLQLARAALDLLVHPSHGEDAVHQTTTALGAVKLAPRTSLNARTGANRTLRRISRPLDELKRVASAHGAKVNDVVLAAVTSGLRDVLRERDELEDIDELRVLVPVSLRADAQHLELGNVVGAIFMDLPVGEQDAPARLHEIATRTRAAKQRGDPAAAAMATRAADLLPPSFITPIATMVHREPFINLVVTNVPGPQAPLYALGARMVDAIPLVPLAGNLTVGVAVLSYDGDVVLGIRADPDAWPDLAVLLEGIEKGFDELRSAGPVTQASRTARR